MKIMRCFIYTMLSTALRYSRTVGIICISLFFLTLKSYGQTYYWEKSNLFPTMADSGFTPGSLYARDGVLIYNAADKYRHHQWYASNDTLFNFKRAIYGGDNAALSWSGYNGGWISLIGQSFIRYNKVLDSIMPVCSSDNYVSIHAYVTGNVVFHKGRYYMTGAEPNANSSIPDETVLLIFDPTICKWIKLPAITPLYRLFEQGNTLYVTSNGTANEDTVYKSDDEAATWQKVTLPAYYFGNSTNYPKNRFNTDKDGNVILRMAEQVRNFVDSSSQKTRFYALQNGIFNLLPMTNDYSGDRLALYGGFRSSDAGNLYYIVPIASSYEYQAIGDILVKSSDKGNSWKKIDAVAPEYMTDVVETSNGRVFATTNIGVYELKMAKPQGCSDLTYKAKVYPTGKSCNIFNIEMHVSGGKKPYLITLHNKTYQTNDSIVVSDTLGLYPIKIIDSMGCVLNTSALVSRQHIDSLHVVFGYPLPGQCNASGFGALVWKGMPPYTVQWTDGDSTYKKIIPKEMDNIWGSPENFPLTKIADYSFTIKDSLGCKIHSDTIHKRLLQTKVTYTPTVACDSAVASIDILTTLSDVNYITASINNNTILSTQWKGKTVTVKLPYNADNAITIRDTNHCSQNYNEYWTKSSASLGYIANIGCDSMHSLGHMNIAVQNTNPYTTMRWSDINRDTFLVYRDKLPAAHYSVSIKDKLMCVNATLNFDITAQPIPLADLPAFLCVGDTFTIRPYIADPAIKGNFFYGINRQSTMADSLIFTMPDLADTTVNLFFVNQNPQCASEINQLVFKRNSSIKPIGDSLITYCAGNQDIPLSSVYANTIWYSVQQKNIIDTNNIIHFKPSLVPDTVLAYIQSASGICHSGTSQIIIQQTDFHYRIDTSASSPWIYLHGGKGAYQLHIAGDTMFTISNIKDTVWLENILSPGNYNLSVFDSNNCDIAIKGISIHHKDSGKQTDFILYPNPATNYIQISGIYNSAAVLIYSIDGKKVFEGSSVNQQLIALPDLSSALYFVKVEEGNKRNIFKLMVK